ncbi:MAG: hypothetical protein ACRDZ8_03820, partial [Acidimicrobiales bacterium]
ALRPLSWVRGWGPAPELISLASWAAWRWAGPRAAFMRVASPDAAVRRLPPPLRASLRDLFPPPKGPPIGASGQGVVPAQLGSPFGASGPGVGQTEALVQEALRAGKAILRLAPAADLLPVVVEAAALGPCLVVTPLVAQASVLAERLRMVGVAVALMPGEWAQAAAGAPVVIGARGAAWAPCPGLASIVVLDGHEEGLAAEGAPTWNAWVVAAERAHRARVPCIVVSACPTVEMLAWRRARSRLVVPDRLAERAGWAALEVVDRRKEDRRSGLYSPRLVGLLRGGRRVVCVLNRKGRVRLLACSACGELTRCERCGGAVALAEGTLSCARCGTTRPLVCLACGSTRSKALRVGVSRAREELEVLAGRPVGEVTSDTGELGDEGVLVGTEAVLRRVREADAVAFLDFDQELLAPRYRASEEALGLLAVASRLVGGRSRSGRVLVQTRLPQHEVVMAALMADPARLASLEAPLRRDLSLPPETAVALVSGSAADGYVAALEGVEVLGPDRERWLVKASDHRCLADALSAQPHPGGRQLRIEVDPLRL